MDATRLREEVARLDMPHFRCTECDEHIPYDECDGPLYRCECGCEFAHSNGEPVENPEYGIQPLCPMCVVWTEIEIVAPHCCMGCDAAAEYVECMGDQEIAAALDGLFPGLTVEQVQASRMGGAT